MRLRERGQSTAEYAILIGLVVAVAAGFLSVSLKGAMRSKNEQATKLLMQAGDATLSVYGTGASDIPLYVQEVSKTTVKGGDEYKNITVLEKGGSEKKLQQQVTETTAVSVETLDGTN